MFVRTSVRSLASRPIVFGTSRRLGRSRGNTRNEGLCGASG